MSHDDSIRSNLRRTFRDLSEKEVADVETASVLVQMDGPERFPGKSF
jgi:hypothetical protein